MSAEKRRGFQDKWMLMREIMGDASLSHAEVAVAFWYLDHANSRTELTYPGPALLRTESGLSRSSIKRARKKLVSVGVLLKQQPRDRHLRVNCFRPNWAWKSDSGSPVNRDGVSGAPTNGVTDDPDQGSRTTPKQKKEAGKEEPINEQEPSALLLASKLRATPSDANGVDWSGWIDWLMREHGVTAQQAWQAMSDWDDQLRHGGFSEAAAHRKIDVLLKVARKQRIENPLGFVSIEVIQNVRKARNRMSN